MENLIQNKYNPDVLNCLANLSNDEVFTPPKIANEMLDLLPQDLFSNPDSTFLDPACKSGVFLREIAKRLIKGLETKIPDLQKRIDHIFHHQLFAIAITELTSLLSRRSVYCSKYPDQKFSVSHFDNEAGNIRFKRINHTWENGSCKYCGASEDTLGGELREKELETHAYEWIHTLDPETIFNMKFDVIISNPPYQMSSNDAGIQATPLYDRFVLQSMKLNPQNLVMIIPARWFTGGMGLDKFREKMLLSNKIRQLVEYQKSRDCFTGVDIAGGVCYFLWDKNFNGPCKVVNKIQDKSREAIRKLDEFSILVRDNIGIGIVRKVLSFKERMLDTMVESISPFGLSTKNRGKSEEFPNSIKVISSTGIGYMEFNEIPKGQEYIDKYKVSIGQLNPDRGGVNNASDGKSNVTTKVKIYDPKVVFTATYLLLGAFAEKEKANNYASYIKSKFVRFLILVTLSSMHITKNNFQFVPIQDFTREWTDKLLYQKYNLDKFEIDFIESTIRPMDLNGASDDAE